MNGLMDFEWDDEKAKINLVKHGISFDEAKTVFYDENAILFDDPEHSLDEDRFLLIGMSLKLNILLVSHCIRKGDIIRIISARRATKKETEQYIGINRGE